MKVCRATTIVTMVIAIFVAITVPVSQLRTPTIVTTCCCPDPSNCHCPSEKAHHHQTPSMRACHRSSHDLVTSRAPACALTTYTMITNPPTRVIALKTWLPSSPHPSPDPTPPSAPS